MLAGELFPLHSILPLILSCGLALSNLEKISDALIMRLYLDIGLKEPLATLNVLNLFVEKLDFGRAGLCEKRY
jgi:hypothetical protein